MRALLLALLALVICAPVSAQMSNPPTNVSPILGSYAIATMPACNATIQAKYAFITDLGGGADMLLCDGSNWKRIRLGAPVSTAVSGALTLRRLQSAPIQIVTGSGNVTFNIDATDLVDGDQFYIRKVGTLGTLGLALSTGGTTLPLLGNSTMFVVYSASCACLQQIQ